MQPAGFEFLTLSWPLTCAAFVLIRVLSSYTCAAGTTFQSTRTLRNTKILPLVIISGRYLPWRNGPARNHLSTLFIVPGLPALPQARLARQLRPNRGVRTCLHVKRARASTIGRKVMNSMGCLRLSVPPLFSVLFSYLYSMFNSSDKSDCVPPQLFPSSPSRLMTRYVCVCMVSAPTYLFKLLYAAHKIWKSPPSFANRLGL